MAAPPEKKSKDSSSITMLLDKDQAEETATFSPVHRISGFPWRVRVTRLGSFFLRYGHRKYEVDLICDGLDDCELWECKTKISYRYKGNTRFFDSFSYHSYGTPGYQIAKFDMQSSDPSQSVEIEIEVESDSDSWRRYPILDPLQPKDGILVIGEEKKKIEVDKKSLAAQSPFFDRLFYGDFKEKNMDEIPIGGVEFEEFSNIIKIVYRLEGASLTDENVRKVLELADRFELKIVEDRVISYLLHKMHFWFGAKSSSKSSFTLHQKLLISEQHNLPYLKAALLPFYKSQAKIRELSRSAEWNLLSRETIREALDQEPNRSISSRDVSYDSD